MGDGDYFNGKILSQKRRKKMKDETIFLAKLKEISFYKRVQKTEAYYPKGGWVYTDGFCKNIPGQPDTEAAISLEKISEEEACLLLIEARNKWLNLKQLPFTGECHSVTLNKKTFWIYPEYFWNKGSAFPLKNRGERPFFVNINPDLRNP